MDHDSISGGRPLDKRRLTSTALPGTNTTGQTYSSEHGGDTTRYGRKGWWRMRNRRLIRIEDMSGSHLRNSLRMMLRLLVDALLQNEGRVTWAFVESYIFDEKKPPINSRLASILTLVLMKTHELNEEHAHRMRQDRGLILGTFLAENFSPTYAKAYYVQLLAAKDPESS